MKFIVTNPRVFHSLKGVSSSCASYELQQVDSKELLFCITLQLISYNSQTSISLKKLVKIGTLGRCTGYRTKNNMKKHIVQIYGSHQYAIERVVL